MGFYSLFVNTKGTKDGHIAEDDRMERHVGVTKKHLKHMTSNQTARNINNKTSALGGIQEISKSFDASDKGSIHMETEKRMRYPY